MSTIKPKAITPLKPLLRVGDVVRHRSGGPTLVVIAAPSGGVVTVEWFDKQGPQAGIVSLAAVELVPTGLKALLDPEQLSD